MGRRILGVLFSFMLCSKRVYLGCSVPMPASFANISSNILEYDQWSPPHYRLSQSLRWQVYSMLSARFILSYLFKNFSSPNHCSWDWAKPLSLPMWTMPELAVSLVFLGCTISSYDNMSFGREESLSWRLLVFSQILREDWRLLLAVSEYKGWTFLWYLYESSASVQLELEL